MAVLNKRTLHGLGMMAGLAEAGCDADILGYDPQNKEDRDAIADVHRACEWIRQKQRDWDLTHKSAE